MADIDREAGFVKVLFHIEFVCDGILEFNVDCIYPPSAFIKDEILRLADLEALRSNDFLV